MIAGTHDGRGWCNCGHYVDGYSLPTGTRLTCNWCGGEVQPHYGRPGQDLEAMEEAAEELARLAEEVRALLALARQFVVDGYGCGKMTQGRWLSCGWQSQEACHKFVRRYRYARLIPR